MCFRFGHYTCGSFLTSVSSRIFHGIFTPLNDFFWQDEKTSSAKEAAEKYVSFLTRVFADVDFTSEESVWKSGVEAHIEALKSKVTEAAAEAAAAASSKQTEAAAEAEESSKSSEEIERLEKQVTHYKSSLHETVSSNHNFLLTHSFVNS